MFRNVTVRFEHGIGDLSRLYSLLHLLRDVSQIHSVVDIKTHRSDRNLNLDSRRTLKASRSTMEALSTIAVKTMILMETLRDTHPKLDLEFVQYLARR